MVDLRRSNRARMIEVLFRHGPISRAEISEITGLTPPTITALASQLIQDGLLEEAGVQDDRTTVGRKRIKLQLIADSRVAVGVEIGIKDISLGLVNLNGQIVETSSIVLSERDPRSVIRTVAGGINALLRRYPHGKIIGLGIGATGLVDSLTGVVRHSPNLGWKNVPLRQLLEHDLSIPVIVDNNVRLMAFGENMFCHNQPDVSRMALIHAGYGIGCGLIVNGELYYGRANGAGEFGHTVIIPRGPVCTCGKRGCLEAVASGRAMASRFAQEIGQPGLDYQDGLKQLLAAGQREEQPALGILQEAGAYMGIALSNLMSLLAPDLIALHGSIFDSSVYISQMAQEIKDHTFGDGDVVPIKQSQRRDELVILGAGALTIQRILINDGMFRQPLFAGEQ